MTGRAPRTRYAEPRRCVATTGPDDRPEKSGAITKGGKDRPLRIALAVRSRDIRELRGRAATQPLAPKSMPLRGTMNNDDPKAAGQLAAVQATLRALITDMAKTDVVRRGNILTDAGNTINQRFPEGAEEHKMALEALNMGIFGG